jgi:hypothetical protein
VRVFSQRAVKYDYKRLAKGYHWIYTEDHICQEGDVSALKEKRTLSILGSINLPEYRNSKIIKQCMP